MKISSPLKKAHWPWSKMDIREVAMQACCNKIYMPNIGFIPVEVERSWQAELGDAANSKRLWINSLVSAHACLQYAITIENESEKIISVGANLIKSYLDFYYSDEGVFKDAWKDEHAVTNRLFVLTAFLHCLTSSEFEDISNEIKKIIKTETLFSHALIHAEWLNNDYFYVKNNHGVMADMALAQFSIFLSEINKSLQKRYISTSKRRLDMMFDLTFDKNGCCTENSPAYHFVNYSLFSAVLKFFQEYDLLDEFNSKWAHRLEMVRDVGNLFLRLDGSIPTIGDSEIKLGTFFPLPDLIEKKYGIGFYPESGFFIASSPEFHLTFKAGGVSYSHRHIDDLSLTLQFKGKSFIVDCGMYNYDIQDKMRRWFISSRAHSGIYVDSAGDVRFANFKSPQAMSKLISMNGDNSKFFVYGEHNLSKEVKVERAISYEKNILLIEDFFECDSDQSWRVQFNLHPEVQVDMMEEKNVFLLKNGEAALKLVLDAGYQIQIETINYSPKFMTLEKSNALVIKGRNNSLRLKSSFHF